MNKFKKSSLLITIISTLAFLFLSNLGLNKYYYSKFTSSKWVRYENKRVLMVDNLLKDNKLEEKNKEDILTLLGKPTKSEKTSNTIIYYLGSERSLISVDSESLFIYFDKKEKCIKSEIIID
ncbi:hypothetical protein [Clostridium sp. CF012]|uniref:hypothetical protein n=1 Tax=Clostridium sp. CF012 TaxID=2843319 RepID=UPI001C0C9ACA|nr:hypothetical protein [Clostridium sp. CF012]MBU3146931.1 hypothetical protein [Clostridium sp. CF012]